MLISFPFLPEPNAVTGYELAALAEVAKLDDCESVHGTYPLSYQRSWHGGIHLHPQTIGQPVRAIADGTVVAYRLAGTAVEEGQDNGFVLLKHETETGNGRPITFYSLYMHLANTKDIGHEKDKSRSVMIPLLRQPGSADIVADGKTKVYRKDILGYCGKMYGHTMIHFEIFMVNDDFNAYFNHTQLGKETVSTDGDAELWGDCYFVIPAGGRLYDKTHTATGSTEKRLFVRVSYDKGSKTTTVWQDEGKDKTPTLIPYQDVQSGYVESDYEYNLYKTATDRYPACPSAGYELLRFGRVIGPDKDKLSKEQSVNWQPIVYAPGKLGYVDLSAANILKLSDADFPSFMGWTKISEGDSVFANDGICDIKAILDVLAEAEKAGAKNPGETHDSLAPYLQNNEVTRKKLRGLICESPTEWDKAGNATRYARLLKPGEHYDGNPDGYKKFLDFVEKFQFWDKTGLPTKIWHFHPLAFIEQFRTCRWLSEKEFKQFLPKMVLRGMGGKAAWEAVPKPNADEKTNPVFTIHRIPLNKTFRKYGINTPYRMAAFFGNSIQETQWWSKLHENNKAAWYYPWDGRGFLQLTHIYNYITYWKFRGRKIDVIIENKLKMAQGAAEKKRENSFLTDSVSGVTTQMKEWRELVGTNNPDMENSSDAADSAGVYWAWISMARYADGTINIERCKIPTSSGEKIYYRSEAFWKASASVNLPGVINQPYDHRLNGFIDRCVPWAQALAVLTDMRFPNVNGVLELDYPEGHEPRREK
ncbi:hypothetical protein LT85_2314 [Collimonas arenae]|uniref:Uncharacterized protein n=1 Tax=Collimonas arenae TaxID=279058 RepID=A0A0A1FF46_9BURK|nr:M23 family metallopeptidase [Collimonas arenae]AIY41472.1 hypothetical protein LT85_2314 [Collimonas arenae]